MFSNKETKGIFWYLIKKLKKVSFFFELKQTYDGQKFKILYFPSDIVLIFCYEIGIFGPYFFASIFLSDTLAVKGCWGQQILFFWNLVDKTQMSTPPEHTRHHDSRLLLILLSLRAIYFSTFQYETPCIRPVRIQKSSIFNFEYINEIRICGKLGVKQA